MTTDAAARAYLDHYLDRPGDPEFALMLERPWGSGKSHFFDQYFKARHTAALAKNPNAKPEIRVSLFGIAPHAVEDNVSRSQLGLQGVADQGKGASRSSAASVSNCSVGSPQCP